MPDGDQGAEADQRANGDRRTAELVTALGALRSRISTASRHSGRDPHSVTLIAVTKNRPSSDVSALAHLGVLDIGENKDQEARAKIADLGEARPDIRWHFVGRLQTNKARSVASYAHAVHSVDRPKLVRALADAARDVRATVLEVFLQLRLDDDQTRGGAPFDAMLPLADAIAERGELRLRGVMAVPPIDAEPEAAFARLAEYSSLLRAQHPQADAISAGMSDDLDHAIAHGSTHVRVGTALLGRRDSSFG